MTQSPSQLEEAGLEVTDLSDESVYAARRLHSRNGSMQMEGLHRLAVASVDSPDTILQELVNAAVRLYGADSAGVSIERDNRTPEHFCEWIATAGEYSSFMGASLPQYPSAVQPAWNGVLPNNFGYERPSSISLVWRLLL